MFQTNALFQRICRFFTKRFIPEDHEMEFAEALFKWKYGK